MMIRKLLREPLFHFLLLGGALFYLYASVSGDPASAGSEIVIDEQQLSILSSSFERVWQRAPTEVEVQALVDAHIQEEVMYREGVLLSLDRDDAIVRRRVAQKMSFIADGLVPNAPTEAELESWLAGNASDYRVPAIFSLRQVYIDPQRHADDLESVVASTKAALSSTPAEVLLGDSTMLPSMTTKASQLAIERTFGSEFAVAIEALEVGGWQGPVQSSFGLHFVDISERVPARDPLLDEVRSAVQRDFLNSRSQEISEAFYQSLLERYTIRYTSAE